MSERLSVADARVALDYTYEAAAVESHFDVNRYCDARNAYRDALLAARDAEWRAAVGRLKADHLTVHRNPLSVLDEILAAMEVPHDGQ